MVVVELELTFTQQSLTNALYDLAAYPEYVEPLREEIAPLVAAEGWTKAAFGKMWKVDSFLKESHRYNGMSICASLPAVPLYIQVLSLTRFCDSFHATESYERCDSGRATLEVCSLVVVACSWVPPALSSGEFSGCLVV